MATFALKKEILYVTRYKFYLCQDSKTPPISIPWNGRDSNEAFALIKGKCHSTIFRIIVGYDFSYTLSLQLPITSKKEEIIARAGEAIPEPITGENISFFASGKDHIQVFVVPQVFLNGLREGAKNNGFQIEYLCPIQGVLANTEVQSKNPRIILYSGIEKLAVAVSGNIVLDSENIIEEPDKRVSDLVKFAQNQFSLEIKEAYSNFSEGNPKLSSGLVEKKSTIDPIGFVASHTLADKNENFLAIKIKELNEPQETSEANTIPLDKKTENTVPEKVNPTEHEEPDGQKKPSIVIPIALIAIIVIAVGYIIYKSL